ncbi:MAG: hypothetical protein JW955_13205 [Sedimentisphaerales bacterium]|nr:hypothetical protein [Sedimentisphaerales bacterium]
MSVTMQKADGANDAQAVKVFCECVSAIRARKLIRRESSHDKEFHFQNWVRDRLQKTKLAFETGGRNSYPDFRLVAHTVGFEVKGLAYPGREINYDCNSQVPTGLHNGRMIYYVFGRYPPEPDGNAYPVLDLVMCHGDFLNADHDYVHKNRSVKGFGSYGDIMIRDRKMYVAPTPFGLASGVAHAETLILPADVDPGKGMKCVGALVRVEAPDVIVGYSFDLRANTIIPQKIPNPSAGRTHPFRAWRVVGSPDEPVALLPKTAVPQAEEVDDADAQY